MYHFVQYLAATAIVVVVIPGGIGMIVGQDWWKRLWRFWWRYPVTGPLRLAGWLVYVAFGGKKPAKKKRRATA